MRYFFLIALLFLACSTPKSSDDNSHLRNPQIPLAEGDEIEFAKGFQIIQFLDHKQINIIDLNNKNTVVQKIFIGKGARDKEEYLPTPIASAACNSTTHVSYFAKLDIVDRLIGVSWPDLIMNEKVKEKLDQGKIKAIGKNGEMNLEVILQISPDILMVYPYESLSYQQYEDAGLQLVYNTEYQEVHPLAKAEWIKLYGLLFNKEEEAKQIFEMIKERYLEHCDLAKDLVKAKGSPSVFTGSFLNGQWFAPSANSSTVRSLEDAGATYVFSDMESIGNLQLDLEVMYQKCKDADFYGKLISDAIDLDDMQTQEKRLTTLRAVKEGNVFYCNTSRSDYFGDALLEPDVVLHDLVKIFFPSQSEYETNRYFHLVDHNP
ncbi:MAG: ABC transporter substrate-binding protein [Flavobacteriales bacterium]|nr:ABC transporter substrate-binding protein [Flavobacteriales bacterium]